MKTTQSVNYKFIVMSYSNTISNAYGWKFQFAAMISCFHTEILHALFVFVVTSIYLGWFVQGSDPSSAKLLNI